MTGVGSSPALATCETSQVLLAGVSGGFPGVFPFHRTYRLARLDMSEIILSPVKLNQKKKNNNNNNLSITMKYHHICIISLLPVTSHIIS